MTPVVEFVARSSSVVCFRFTKDDNKDSSLRKVNFEIYSARDYPFFVGSTKTSSVYNLIDADGNEVAEFDEAQRIAIGQILSYAEVATKDNLTYELSFNPEFLMLRSEFLNICDMIFNEFEALSLAILNEGRPPESEPDAR